MFASETCLTLATFNDDGESSYKRLNEIDCISLAGKLPVCHTISNTRSILGRAFHALIKSGLIANSKARLEILWNCGLSCGVFVVVDIVSDWSQFLAFSNIVRQDQAKEDRVQEPV